MGATVGSKQGGTKMQLPYHDALIKLKTSTSGIMYNHTTASSFFDYNDTTTPGSGPYKSQRHQVWFETPGSLAVKYAALKQLGLRGVSFWHSGSVQYYTPNGEADSMWDALGVWARTSCALVPRSAR